MTPKKIAVLGGGNGAHTMAAEFTLRGHTVNMYEMPQFKDNMKKVFETGKIKAKGVFNGVAQLNLVTDDIAQAVEGCRYICIVAPASPMPAMPSCSRATCTRIRSSSPTPAPSPPWC